MRVWSRMALALAAGTWVMPAFAAEDKPVPKPVPKAEKPADDVKTPVDPPAAEEPNAEDEAVKDVKPAARGQSVVKLQVVIGGLSTQGCVVEVKPGHASCRFKKQTCRVASDGVATLVFKDVEVRGVDRNCTFAITMREPGQDPKTVHRGFRLVASSADSPNHGVQSFRCLMSSPSKVAGLEREGRIVR